MSDNHACLWEVGMYCPGPSKDQEMPLEGETWGMEVESLLPKVWSLGPVRHADLRVHPTPNSLGQHQHVSLVHWNWSPGFKCYPGRRR